MMSKTRDRGSDVDSGCASCGVGVEVSNAGCAIT